jgi:hypothetical protein
MPAWCRVQLRSTAAAISAFQLISLLRGTVKNRTQYFMVCNSCRRSVLREPVPLLREVEMRERIGTMTSSFKQQRVANPTWLYTQLNNSASVHAILLDQRNTNLSTTHAVMVHWKEWIHIYLYAPSCMYKRPGWVYQIPNKNVIYGSSAFVRVHVGDSASTNVCHQPHDTFSGR